MEQNMPTDPIGGCPPKDEETGIKRCTPKELIRHEPKDLEVPERTEVFLSPFEREFADHYFRVELKSHQDLRLLGLLPSGIPEDKLLQAMAADDEEARKLAHTKQTAQVDRACHCESNGGPMVRPYGVGLRRDYARIRKSYHPATAALLSDYYRTRVEWDSPLPGILRYWANRLALAGEISMYVPLFRDITINRGATLTVDPSDKLLLAGSIWIHRAGQLVHRGGYLKIWAKSILQFSDFNDIIRTEARNFPWKPNP